MENVNDIRHPTGNMHSPLFFLTHLSHFQEDIFKFILMNKKFCILIRISLKFVPKGPINNIPAMGQIMAWRRSDDNPLFEPMLIEFTDAYMRH